MGEVHVITGMAFGDEGVGSLTDFLVRRHQAGTVVRYNGGAQEAHSVVLPDGRYHTFAQFGSGTLAGARTHLSKHMVVNPILLGLEATNLNQVGVEDPHSLLTVDAEALVTTPYHVAANRFSELLRGWYGSCGIGLGETVLDALETPQLALRVRDFEDPDTMQHKLLNSRARKLKRLKDRTSNLTEAASIEYETLLDLDIVDQCIWAYRGFPKRFEVVDNYLQSLLKDPTEVLVFEGAQGVLLDEDYGFHPYTTWGHTTRKNALNLLGDHTKVKWIGAFRSYFTRHGAGPFPTEDPQLYFEGDHNTRGPWQGPFRFGHFDMILARYAQAVMRCDEIALTCLDHLDCPTPSYGYQERFPYLTVDEVKQPLPWDKLLLARQPSPPDSEQLARALSQATPVYHRPFRDPPEFFANLSIHLKAPVTLLSYGPTYQDKKEHAWKRMPWS